MAGGALAVATPALAQSFDLAARIMAEAQAPHNTEGQAEAARVLALKAAVDAAPARALTPTQRLTTERLLVEGLAVVAADKAKAAEGRAAVARGIALAKAQGLEQSADYAALLSAAAELEFQADGAAAGLPLAEQADALWVRLYGEHSAQRSLTKGIAGNLLNRMGRQREAMAAFTEATREEAQGRYAAAYVEALVGLAQAASGLGEEDLSIDTYLRAREAGHRLLPPDAQGIGMIESELSVHLANAYRLSEAEPVGRAAVDFFRRTTGDTSFDTAAALKNYGSVLSKAGRWGEGEAVLRQAHAILSDPQAHVRQISIRADTLQLLGIAQRALGRHAEAIASYDAALILLEQGKRIPILASDISYFKADALADLEQWDAALVAVEAAMIPARKATPLYSFFRVRAELLHALVLARLGRAQEAWAKAEPVARAMEQRLADPRLTLDARAAQQAIYRTGFSRLVDIAHATGHDEEAFRAAQMAALTEISVSGQALATRVAGEAVRVMQQRAARLATLERERNLAAARGDAGALNAAVAAAEHDLEVAVADLRAANPRYFELAMPQPVGLAKAWAGLASGQALVMPVAANDRMTVLVLTAKGLRVTQAPLPYAPMIVALRSLRGAVEEGRQPDGQAAWLLGGAMFNRDTLAALRGVREVSLLGSGLVSTVPAAMLLTAPPRGSDPRQQPYALRRFAFATRPGLIGGAEAMGLARTGFLGVGAPILGEQVLGAQAPALRGAKVVMRGGMADAASLRDLPSLPRAAEELADLARAWPAQARLLTGAKATEQALRAEDLERYGVMAFATHGLTGGELGSLNEPALVLTPPATTLASENDGLLTASEVAGLRLDADWVILSACNSGGAEQAGAGGFSGLARGFIQAGARNLLVSLWPLRDDAAARISVGTVRGVASGLSRAEALRRAMLAMIADRSVPDGGNPAIWAPFTLVSQR